MRLKKSSYEKNQKKQEKKSLLRGGRRLGARIHKKGSSGKGNFESCKRGGEKRLRKEKRYWPSVTAFGSLFGRDSKAKSGGKRILKKGGGKNGSKFEKKKKARQSIKGLRNTKRSTRESRKKKNLKKELREVPEEKKSG